MIREKYSDLVFACKCLAAFLKTNVEVKEYSEYGWVAIMFYTDKFGGCYTNLHYDLGTGNLRKNYGMESELDIDCLSTLYEVVKEDLDHELKVRDFDALSDFINAEYD